MFGRTSFTRHEVDLDCLSTAFFAQLERRFR